ncbi:MAG: exonuclease SbcCD subunit D [Burkholderiales bacterium]
MSSTIETPIEHRDIVIVHSSDVHLDHDSEERGTGDSTRYLEAVLGAAREAKADLVLLAGDTFESNRQPPEFIDRVAAMFAESPAPIVLLPGNHDPLLPDTLYRRIQEAKIDLLHILGLTHDELLGFDAFDLEIWGRAHRDYNDMIPFEQVPARRRRWHIAMGHGHYEPSPDRGSHPRPSWLIGDAELAATQADYVALGHWNRAVKVGGEEVLAHYSGSPDLAKSVNVIRLRSTGMVEVHALGLNLAT